MHPDHSPRSEFARGKGFASAAALSALASFVGAACSAVLFLPCAALSAWRFFTHPDDGAFIAPGIFAVLLCLPVIHQIRTDGTDATPTTTGGKGDVDGHA